MIFRSGGANFVIANPGVLVEQGIPWSPYFLLRDDFITAGAALQRACEPGPGRLTLVQNDGQLSTSAGKLAWTTQTTPAWGDQGLIGVGQARLAGRALCVKVQASQANMGFGWNDQSPIIDDPRQWSDAVLVTGTIGFIGGGVTPTPVGSETNVLGTEYSYAHVLRSAGSLLFIKGGIFTQWRLMWVHNSTVGATVYPALTNYDSVGTLDALRVTDLGAPYNTDYGLATQRLAGSQSAGVTFTHTADCVIEWVNTTRANWNILCFRQVDASNYWDVLIDGSGTLQLAETVGGIRYVRGSEGTATPNGTRFVVVADGTTIRVYSNNVLRITYSSASNFATATAGSMGALGASGVVFDIVSWPRLITGAAATLLDDAVAGNASVYLLNDEFTTAMAAPLPRTAEPGPGTLTVTDTGNKLSVSGGKLIAGGTALYDPALASSNSARVVGRAVAIKVNAIAIRFMAGMAKDASERYYYDFSAATTVSFIDTVVVDAVVLGALPRETTFFIVARTIGALYIRKSGASWILDWVSFLGTGTIGRRIDVINATASAEFDFVRDLDLPSPFNSDYGLATQRLAGARTAGDLFTHEANCVIELTQVSLASTVTEFRFRIQDANNHWYIRTDNTGVIVLREVVAGGATTRGTASGVLSNGHRIVIVCDSTTIRVYSNNVLRITYSSASNFATATAGELNALGTGGAVGDICSWPRVLSAPASSYLDLALA